MLSTIDKEKESASSIGLEKPPSAPDPRSEPKSSTDPKAEDPPAWQAMLQPVSCSQGKQNMQNLAQMRDERQAVTGAVCIRVNYFRHRFDVDGGPSRDILGLKCCDGEVDRNGSPRVFVSILRQGGPAELAGVHIGDEVVAICPHNRPAGPPHRGTASLEGLQPPCALLIMSFAGHFPAEVRLPGEVHRWPNGLRSLENITGASVVKLEESIVMQPVAAPMFIFRENSDQQEDEASSAFYELQPRDCRRIVQRVLERDNCWDDMDTSIFGQKIMVCEATPETEEDLQPL